MENKIKEYYDIAIIGGDKRLTYMARIFKKKGYKVYCTQDGCEDNSFAYTATGVKEAINLSHIIVGGIPFLKDEKVFSSEWTLNLSKEEIFSALKKGHQFFAGMLSEELEKVCREKEVICYDFMKDELLTVFNTVATAEGAILEALKNKETNIHKSRTLVLGYGRCAKTLGDKLKGLSAQVTVCCRNEEQLECAAACGFNTFLLKELKEKVNEFEYIYNTIPFLILDKDMLQNVRRDALIIDIASGKGGIDFEAAQMLGIRALLCPGLPGKYAPQISAEKLADYVMEKTFGKEEKKG